MQVTLCLDVGGTEIKGAALGEEGALLGKLTHFPAHSQESAPFLLDHFTAILRQLTPEDGSVSAVGLAFPGPFDYEKGICLIRGLKKYDALYGMELGKELALRLYLPRHPFFLNDVQGFALGEMGFGAAQGAQKAMFVCIGTGCGSAFGWEGNLADASVPGVPPDGYLYPVPFLEGCIDDYISRRGLKRLSQEILGEALEGKELAQRVQQGQEGARECFARFGLRLRDALLPFLESYGPQVLCLGGQITRSGPLFLGPLQEACHARNISLSVTADTSLRTIQGLYRWKTMHPEGLK